MSLIKSERAFIGMGFIISFITSFLFLVSLNTPILYALFASFFITMFGGVILGCLAVGVVLLVVEYVEWALRG